MTCYAVIDTNVLVSALLSSHADAYLVTGNMKHFPSKPFIVTANEFLDILNTTN
jgi:hypothetical protein